MNNTLIEFEQWLYVQGRGETIADAQEIRYAKSALQRFKRSRVEREPIVLYATIHNGIPGGLVSTDREQVCRINGPGEVCKFVEVRD